MKIEWLLGAAIVLAVRVPGMASDTSKACALVTPAELESVVGDKVALKGSTLGKVELCSGHTPRVSVMLRMAPRPPGAGNEAAGVAAAKKMGAQLEMKTFGPITCSTIVPPKEKEMYGFNTTCAVVKGGTVAAIEITTRERRNMVPIEKLKPIAEKMAKRF
jgi:hypothetical protein